MFLGALLVKRAMPPAMYFSWNSSKVMSEKALCPRVKVQFPALWSWIVASLWAKEASARLSCSGVR